jgi:hypothetical protein
MSIGFEHASVEATIDPRLSGSIVKREWMTVDSNSTASRVAVIRSAMLHIADLEEIESLLLQLPSLVRKQERRNTKFAAGVREWLVALEEVFAANRLHQSGSIAAIRSTLIAAGHHQVPVDLKFRGHPTRSRVLNAVASQCLRQAVALATDLVSEHRTRVSEAERISQQIIAAAASRDLIGSAPGSRGHTLFLRRLRQGLTASGDLQAALVRVEGLVGPEDLPVLLERALARHLHTIQQE